MTHIEGPRPETSPEKRKSTLLKAINRLKVHDHLCLLYQSREEELASAVPFIRAGLLSQEQCIYIADDNTVSVIVEAMRSGGIDVNRFVEIGQLKILTKRDTYLKHGHFDPELMIDFFLETLNKALSQGWKSLRVTGEMTWMLGPEIGNNRLIEYEAKLNFLLPKHQLSAVCQYNLTRFSPEIIEQVIYTHPFVIWRDTVAKNHYYIPPEEYLSSVQNKEAKVNRLLQSITEREIKEHQLRDSESRYRSIFEQNLDGILFSLPGGQIVHVNPEACRLLQYTEEEIRRLDPGGILKQDEASKAFVSEQRSKDSARGEVTLLRKDGTGFPAEISSTRFKCAQDETEACTITLIHDITERKRIEKINLANLRFHESIGRVHQAIQGTNDLDQMMSDVLDVVLSIFDCDQAWLLFPCDPETPFVQVAMERTRPQYPGALSPGIDIPRLEMTETIRIVLKDPRPMCSGPGMGYPTQHGSAIQMALHPKYGKPWLFGLHQCSFPRIWTEEERILFQEIGIRLADGLTGLLTYRDLRASEIKYRQIVDTANEGICILGKDFVITFVNNRMAEMLGYDTEQMTGRPVSAFMFEEDLTDHFEKMENRRRGLSEHYERRFRHKLGNTVWTLASAVPLFDQKRNFNGSFAMFTDITKRRKAEEELVLAKEKAEHAVRVKTRFLDIAAHELRTPVTGLSLLLQMASRRLARGQAVDTSTLARLQKEADRLTSLVVDLLDVSRLERGVLAFHPVPTRIAHLISEIVEEYQIQASEHRLLFLQPRDTISQIELNIDPIRITQVVTNLLENAVKYSPKQLPIEINLTMTPKTLRVCVTDQGPGIPEKLQRTLFTPFSRGESDQEERSSGLGLGLFISREILKLHDGSIGVLSTEGKGCTFYFDLPLIPVKDSSR